MPVKRPYFLFHIIGWIAFFGFQFLLFPKPDILFKDGHPTPFLIDQFVINIISVLFFYLHYYYLIPELYFKGKWFKYGTGLLLYISITLFIAIQINAMHPNPGDIPTNIHGVPEFTENPLAPPAPAPVHAANNLKMTNEKDFLLIGLFFIKLLLVFLLSVGLKMYSRWQTAEEEKYKAELSFLKAQINPHFLFNTLNGIYVLAIKKSENTASAIMKLSSIMRYVISEGHHDYVELDKEIKYIQDYVDLQKMRLSQNILVDFLMDVPNKSYKISPLLLIPFIENAFKHGISTENNCTIKIHVTVKNGVLELVVENKKYPNTLREEEQSGIGLENTKKRLLLLYPNKHKLVTDSNKERYCIHLKMQLT